MVNTVKSFLIVLKRLALIVLKTALKRAIQKTVEATGNLIINNIAERLIECVTRTIHEIPQASQKRQQKQKFQMIYREKCAYHLSKNKKIIDKLRLIIKYKLNETSRKKLLHNEPSDVAGASQMKHPTTSQWNVAKTSQWYVFTTSYWYVVMTSHGDVMTTSHQYVSTTSQTSLK